jgi:hypothetical protein
LSVGDRHHPTRHVRIDGLGFKIDRRADRPLANNAVARIREPACDRTRRIREDDIAQACESGAGVKLAAVRASNSNGSTIDEGAGYRQARSIVDLDQRRRCDRAEASAAQRDGAVQRIDITGARAR